MHDEYAQAIARMAYPWGWPMVNMINRRSAITKAPEPGRPISAIDLGLRGVLASSASSREGEVAGRFCK